MKIIGAWLIVGGIMSLLFGIVGLQIPVLSLLDVFGPVVGYILKFALIAAGVWVWRQEDRDTLADEPMEREEARSGYGPLIIAGLIIVGSISFIGVREYKKWRVNQLISRPTTVAAWAARTNTDWPCLVLLQRATFKTHSTMEAGCASLVRLPTGEVVALTAGHLLGRDGGVTPGFLRAGLGGLDARKLATLREEITGWELFLPDDTNVNAKATGLYGEAKNFREDCDQVLLNVSPGKDGYPMPPLTLRTEPVTMDESLFVVGVGYDDDGNPVQEVHKAKRIPGLLFTCEFDGPPVALDGNSGAPVLDKNGQLVAIVTGTTFMELKNRSLYSRSFSGHTATELLPVLRAAIAEKGAASQPPEVKVISRSPKTKPKAREDKPSGILPSA